METVVDFTSEEFVKYPERLNLYFHSPLTVIKIRSMLHKGYVIKAVYFGDSLDIHDWFRVYVTCPKIGKYVKYYYTFSYGDRHSENGLIKFLRSIDETLPAEEYK